MDKRLKNLANMVEFLPLCQVISILHKV